jgi:Helix-turn-helix domain
VTGGETMIVTKKANGDSLRLPPLYDPRPVLRYVEYHLVEHCNVAWSATRRQTYTIEEARQILGICRTLAYRKGVLPTVRVAGRLLVPKKALEGMLAKTDQ